MLCGEILDSPQQGLMPPVHAVEHPHGDHRFLGDAQGGPCNDAALVRNKSADLHPLPSVTISSPLGPSPADCVNALGVATPTTVIAFHASGQRHCRTRTMRFPSAPSRTGYRGGIPPRDAHCRPSPVRVSRIGAPCPDRYFQSPRPCPSVRWEGCVRNAVPSPDRH